MICVSFHFKCSQSSFYTVNEAKLCGYYMACCGLTGIRPSSTSGPLEASKPSLTMRLDQCRHSGYKVIVHNFPPKPVTKLHENRHGDQLFGTVWHSLELLQTFFFHWDN